METKTKERLREAVGVVSTCAVEAQLCAGVTVREFLRTLYGVACGPSEREDWSDRKRFRL